MSHKSLTKRGYVLKKKYLTIQDERKIMRELAFQPLVMQAFAPLARPKKFYTYLESQQRYYIPRFYGIEAFGEPEENHLANTGEKVDFKMFWGLLPHQEKAWEAMLKQFGNPEGGGGILSLPCGMGKTSLAIRLAAHLGLKTIVVVNKEFLLKQWVAVIQECTDARVGILQRNKIEVEDKDIVVAMLHSLSLKDYDEHIFNGFGLACIDETHHIGSESFSKALPKIASKYTLGLSATPIRKDGLTQVFMNYIGPVFHKEKRTANNNVWVKFIEIKSESEHFELEMMEHTGTKDTGKMITNISKFEALNHLILEICRLLVKSKPRKVLVLGARREQLEWLNEAWNELSYKNSHNKYATGGLYYGNLGMNKKLYWQMLEASAKCDIIWGTNEIAKEGLDIKDLNTMILLNGGQDVEQAVGRILRKYHEDVPPTVIDLIYKCGNFPKHANVRRDYYDGEDYVMHKHIMEITDDESSVFDQSDKLEKFLERYPEKGAPGTIKPRKRLKKQEIPLANRPPELKPIPIHDHNAPKKTLNLTKKDNKPAPIPISIEPHEDGKEEGWGGYDSESDEGGIYDEKRGLQKGRLYLDDSEDEALLPSLEELVKEDYEKQRVAPKKEEPIVANITFKKKNTVRKESIPCVVGTPITNPKKKPISLTNASANKKKAIPVETMAQTTYRKKNKKSIPCE